MLLCLGMESDKKEISSKLFEITFKKEMKCVTPLKVFDSLTNELFEIKIISYKWIEYFCKLFFKLIIQKSIFQQSDINLINIL